MESFLSKAVRVGYQRTHEMKSKCPIVQLMFSGRWSSREWFNVAGVDILTDLLIMDRLSE